MNYNFKTIMTSKGWNDTSTPHTFAVMEDGIYAAGENTLGCLGISDFKDRNVFTKNEIMNNVNHIKVIGDMTIVETQDNKMHKTNLETGNFDLD